ncbi:MAG: hypothetical protein MUO77_10735 [Anaerolineales bacterium]|nr:hypothetical protein [Anaerolineales bacterium]
MKASKSPDPETLRKALELEWQDHFHMRDQTWRTLQIEATLVVGLIGVDFKFEETWATVAIGLLVVLTAISGLLITVHLRQAQQLKFEHIIKLEKELGLLVPEFFGGVKPPRPFVWMDIFHPSRISTPIFIMQSHLAILIFTIIYVVARLLK